MTIILFVFDEINNQIGLFDWLISFKNDSAAIGMLMKQVNYILEAFESILMIELTPGQPQEALIRMLSKFYAFLITFCKKVSLKQLTAEEEKSLKQLVDLSAKRLQNPLNQYINYVQNAKSRASKENNKKDKEKGKNVKPIDNLSTKVGKFIFL